MALLEGDWQVTALVGDDGSSVLKGRYAKKLRLKFSAGRMTGTTGCNSIFAGYTRSGASGSDLTFSYDYGSTTAYCRDDEADVKLRDLLQEVRHVGEADGVIYLMAENGATIAALEPSEPHKPYWP
ncbi:MAG: META domain-containing protein [Marmoricola sp.]